MRESDYYRGTKTCPICGKVFVFNPMSIYKLYNNKRDKKLKWYCSYTCWRKDGGDSGKRGYI